MCGANQPAECPLSRAQRTQGLTVDRFNANVAAMEPSAATRPGPYLTSPVPVYWNVTRSD